MRYTISGDSPLLAAVQAALPKTAPINVWISTAAEDCCCADTVEATAADLVTLIAQSGCPDTFTRSIETLAKTRAPSQRVVGISLSPDHALEDLIRTIAFASACSGLTGQVLRLHAA